MFYSFLVSVVIQSHNCRICLLLRLVNLRDIAFFTLSIYTFSLYPYNPVILFQYDARFGDAFWNSSKQNLIQHLIMICTSWALVCDVWYLPPEKRKVSAKLDFFVLS